MAKEKATKPAKRIRKNTKRNNQTELNKLGLTQKRTWIVTQKSGVKSNDSAR